MPARKSKFEQEVIVGLDIGTSKITCCIAEVQENEALKVIGLGQEHSSGLKRGVVVNIDETVSAIQKSVEAAQEASGYSVRSVYASLSGRHIRSFNSHGIVAINGGEVTAHDIDRVIDAAKAVAIPADQKIIHILPQEFIVDRQGGIVDPVGMSGVRLECKVHVITGSNTALQNVDKCIRQCGLVPLDIIVNHLADACSVLNQDEKDLGVCLVNIGAGASDISVFSQGAIQYTSVISVAGDQVDNDIAIAFRTPARMAEAIKMKHGGVMPNPKQGQEAIDIVGVADRPSRQITHSALTQVIQPRYEELLALIKMELQQSGYFDALTSGIVFTGGGAQIQALERLAGHLFNMPIRIGMPIDVEGLAERNQDPALATVIGLILYGYQSDHQSGVVSNKGSNQSVFGKLKHWIQENL